MRLKSIHILLILALVPYLFSGCTNSNDICEREKPSIERIYITMELHTPNGQNGDTRSISVTEENRINNVSVLAFEEDGIFTYAQENVVYSGGRAIIPVQASVNSEKYWFMVISNIDIDINSLSAGMTEEQVQQAIDFNSAGNSFSGGFPMWAKTEAKVIDRFTTFGAIFMTRAVARIDIGLNFTNTINGVEAASGISGYTLKEVHLYRSWDKGAVIPESAHYTFSGVSGASVPSSAQIVAPGVPGSGASGIKFVVPEEFPNMYVREIYTAESDRTGKDECVAVVVGIEHQSILSYYRLDFVSSSLEIIPVLRNHRYAFNIRSITGSGYSNPEAALNTVTHNILYDVSDWNINEKELHISGNFYLKMSETKIDLNSRGESKTLIVESNLPKDQISYLFERQSPGGLISNNSIVDVAGEITTWEITYTAQINISGEEIIYKVSFEAAGISADILVSQPPSFMSYTMDCSSILVRGLYFPARATDASNYIELTLNNTHNMDGLQYEIYTNTLNNISFYGAGVFTDSESHTVKLYCTGTPSSFGTTNFTISSNSDIVHNCCINVVAGYSAMRILGVSGGYGYATYGYAMDRSASKAFIESPLNFGFGGSMPVESITMSYPGNYNTVNAVLGAAFLAELNKDPDIVVIGHRVNFSTINQNNLDVIAAILEYADKGGIVIMFDEFPTDNRNLIYALFDDKVISPGNQSGGGASGTRDLILSIPGDPIVTGALDGGGPFFGDIEGKYWGNDASTSGSLTIREEFSDEFVVYSSRSNRATMLRYKNRNVFWCGDGGFLSNNNNYLNGAAASGSCPFAIVSLPGAQPATRTGWSSGNVDNSKIFANIMVWAIHQAHFHGINSGGL